MVESFCPATLSEALRLRAAKGLVPYAGGTDIMVHAPKDTSFLFLRRVPQLTAITVQSGFLHIGACCTYAALLQNGQVPGLLQQAIRQIAAPPVRTLGTLGGNICNASPAGDTLPVLYVLNAEVLLAHEAADGSTATRLLPLHSFIKGVRKTELQANELLCEIIISTQAFAHSLYCKVGARKAQAISKLSFAAVANTGEGGLLQEIRIAYGSVGATVVRSLTIEKAALNGPPDIEQLLAEYSALLNPIDDQRSTARYRKRVCLNLTREFLTSLLPGG